MTTPGHNFKTDEYFKQINDIEDQIKELKRQKSALEADVMENFKEQFDNLLRQKDEPFGKVSLCHGEFVLEYTRPKKVEWDQDKVADLYKKISEHEDPSLYIKTKYDISETAYKNWPEAIKNTFLKARTVKNGPQKVTIKLAD